MGRIKLLSKDLINMIAAGEVVERPASVVKEMLENSIDAGSSEISVRIENFGKDLIEIEDNGNGMDEEDALKAFEQHATSKISKEDDLNHINSLGFRGEALASISSVAEKIELETKAENTKPVKLEIVGTKFSSKPATQTSNGTKISVHNLFKNVPARRKFLKSDNTELKYIVTTFNEIALCHSNIRFELFHNDKLLYRYPKAEQIKDRIFDIYGSSIEKGLFPERIIKTESYQITAFLCRPEAARKSSTIQYISLNNRSIISKAISSAVIQGYQGFIHRDLKPYFFLFIHINPELVDVNVHPRKLEVRFEDQDSIFRDVFRLVKNSLEKETKNIVTSYTNNEEESIKRDFVSQKESLISLKKPSSKGFSIEQKGQVQEALTFTKFLIENSQSTYIEEKMPSVQPSQFFNTFIVYSKDNDLVFIDQHAAAEKILFEKLLLSSDSLRTKPLLIPEIIDLKSEDKEIVLERKDDFAKAGIILGDFGGKSIQITEIPEIIDELHTENYIYEIIHNKDDFSKISLEYSGIDVPKEVYDILALTACHGSVRAGQKLGESEMLKIINDLGKLRNPQSCPHGRPTTWILPKSDIEKNFRRII